jgi:uncharacterized protein
LFDLFNDISPWGLGIMLAGLALASLARGYSGFGFSAVLIASWSLVVDPATPIAVTVLLEISASIIQALSVWKEIPWRRVLVMMGGAAPGMMLGVTFLATVSPQILKFVLSAFVLIAAALLALGWKLQRRANQWGVFSVGIVSGIVNGAIGMGGLPVALFLTADGNSPSQIRASVIAYFFLLDLTGLILFSKIGIMNYDTLAMAVLAFPVLLIGISLGRRHFLGATEDGFKRVTLFMLMGIAMIGLIRSMAG